MPDEAMELAVEPPVLSYIMTDKDYYAMADAGRGQVLEFLSRWTFWPLAIANAGISAWFVERALRKGIALDVAFFWNGAIAAVMIVGRYAAVPLMRRWYLRQSRLEGRRYEVRFEKDAIELSAGGLSSRIDRSEILAYRETEDYFFFWINRFQAIIAPKRAINTPKGEDALRAYAADAKWKKR